VLDLGLRHQPARLLQFNVKAWLAHSAGLAAVALQEVMSAGRTIEVRGGERTAVGVGDRFHPALDALLTDDTVAPDTESSHPRLPIAGCYEGSKL
jgi:hypothetical protein